MDRGADPGQSFEDQACRAGRHFRHQPCTTCKDRDFRPAPGGILPLFRQGKCQFAPCGTAADDGELLRISPRGQSGKLRSEPANRLYRNAVSRSPLDCVEVRRTADIDGQDVEMDWRACLDMDKPVIDGEAVAAATISLAPAICVSRARSMWMSCAFQTP